jgi:hypothetical protein
VEIGIGVASCVKLGASEFLCTECLKFTELLRFS